MDRISTQCASCGARLTAPADAAGKRFKCPKCGASNVITANAAPEMVPQPPRPIENVPKPAPAPAATFSLVPKQPLGPQPAPRAPQRASSSATELAALHAAMDRANKSSMQWLRWVFILAIIPLALHAFSKEEQPTAEQIAAAFQQRLEERLAEKPELGARVAQLQKGPFSLDLFIAWTEAFDAAETSKALQEIKAKINTLSPKERAETLAEVAEKLEAPKEVFMERMSGLQPVPFLSKETWGHWGLAAVAALLFLAYFCFAYPRGNAKLGHLLGIGIFTGTIGVVMLLAVQYLSSVAAQIRMRGHGLLMLIWLILVALAFSYAAADDPSNGFVLSFIGFTLGVGLLEELCKILPLIWVYRQGRDLDWRGACVCGLASGAGFGISEGIIYSARYYNGESQLEMYVVRFVSCVALHAAWAGATAILLYRRRDRLQGQLEKGEWFRVLAPVMIVPMVLHGLYDTLLKMNMVPWALAAGAASYVFFIWLQEREARDQTRASMRLLGVAR